MTIEDARRILGKKVEHLTDEQLLQKMIEADEDLEDFFQETLRKLTGN